MIVKKIMAVAALALILIEAGPFQRVSISGTPTAGLPPLELVGVVFTPQRFSPEAGEAVEIRFQVSAPGKAIVKIFDPDLVLVREYVVSMTAGLPGNTIIWDGRDQSGRVVPDEAYFFTIEARDFHGREAEYDPSAVSGGEVFSLNSSRMTGEGGYLTYSLPKSARVHIRAGIAKGGPLLKNIVFWAPRAAGWHREPWDGTDESHSITAPALRGYQLLSEAIVLPENTIITVGNNSRSYFQYKLAREPLPRKKPAPAAASRRAQSPLEIPILLPKEILPSPKFRIELPDVAAGEGAGELRVQGRTRVRIHLDDEIKKMVSEQRYEILVFVDYRFYTELEEGYSPFTFLWDTTQSPNGERVLTVNVVTLTGQISSNSLSVLIAN